MSDKEHEIKKAEIEAGLVLKIGDYNGNEALDKFYEIDGQRAPIEVDGRPVAEYLDSISLVKILITTNLN